MNKLVNNKKNKNVRLMNKLVNNKKNKKHSKLKHNQLMVILIVHTTKIVLQLEQLGKLLYIKGNQVIALILIVMAMELHVKNSNKKEAFTKLLFYYRKILPLITFPLILITFFLLFSKTTQNK